MYKQFIICSESTDKLNMWAVVTGWFKRNKNKLKFDFSLFFIYKQVSVDDQCSHHTLKEI